jgi:hypothetical protein
MSSYPSMPHLRPGLCRSDSAMPGRCLACTTPLRNKRTQCAQTLAQCAQIHDIAFKEITWSSVLRSSTVKQNLLTDVV